MHVFKIYNANATDILTTVDCDTAVLWLDAAIAQGCRFHYFYISDPC